MTDLPVRLSRTVDLGASPDRVWGLITASEGWDLWWGPDSTIDPSVGGSILITYPNGQQAKGEVLEFEPGRRLSFTWGYPREDAPIPVGGSRVTIELKPIDSGAHLTLSHDVADENVRDIHVPGWRYQLGLLRALVAHEVLGPLVASTIDAWHEAWSNDDPEARASTLTSITTPDIVVADAAALTAGVDDLLGFVAQSRHIFPATVRRTSRPLINGNSVSWDWELGAGGMVVEGRSVATVTVDARFSTVISYWLNAPPGVPTSVI